MVDIKKLGDLKRGDWVGFNCWVNGNYFQFPAIFDGVEFDEHNNIRAVRIINPPEGCPKKIVPEGITWFSPVVSK